MRFWRAAAFSVLTLLAVITVDSLRRIWRLRRQIEEIHVNWNMEKREAWQRGHNHGLSPWGKSQR